MKNENENTVQPDFAQAADMLLKVSNEAMEAMKYAYLNMDRDPRDGSLMVSLMFGLRVPVGDVPEAVVDGLLPLMMAAAVELVMENGTLRGTHIVNKKNGSLVLSQREWQSPEYAHQQEVEHGEQGPDPVLHLVTDDDPATVH